MSPKPDQTDGLYRTRVPADVDQPDKIVYGLTARQLAILAVAAVAAYGIFKAVGGLLPQPVLIALMLPLAGVAIVLALGRRDGLSLDAWLLAAIRHNRAPRHLVPASDGAIPAAPAWAPQTAATAPVSVLRRPAEAISDTGIIDTGAQSATLVACTTVNINLRTGDEQAALIGGFGRWLNSLSAPAQIVISAQRVDLSSHAQRIADNAATIANQALAEAARDYADFLDDLSTRRDPLWRTVTVAVTAAGEKGRDNDVTRRAEQAAGALAALGVQTSILDGARVTSVLTVAADPYTPADVSWARARPGAIITGACAVPEPVCFVVQYAFLLLYLGMSDVMRIVDMMKIKGLRLDTRNPFRILPELPKVMVPAVSPVACRRGDRGRGRRRCRGRARRDFVRATLATVLGLDHPSSHAPPASR